MIDLGRRLSPHFTLRELLRSEVAERDAQLFEAQVNPPPEVVSNLEHLVERALEPIRQGIGFPLRVTSGYRSPGVNRRVGGARRSQHLLGQAADLHLLLPEEPAAARELRRELDAEARRLTGLSLRRNINADFLLFAWVILRLAELDVDQIIHEFGEGPGRPAWVHVSSSPGAASRRQILFISRSGTVSLDVAGAFRLGTG